MKKRNGKRIVFICLIAGICMIFLGCASTDNNTSPSIADTSSVQSQENPQKTPVTLETGTYIASGTNFKMKFDSPVFATLKLFEGDQFFGLDGKYKINENVITISFSDSMMPGEDSTRKGKSYAYMIMNNTTFMGNGEIWVKI